MRKEGGGQQWTLGLQGQVGKLRQPLAGVGPPRRARAPPTPGSSPQGREGAAESGQALPRLCVDEGGGGSRQDRRLREEEPVA